MLNADDATPHNVGDMLIKVEERRPAVVREVLRAAERALPENVRSLVSDFI